MATALNLTGYHLTFDDEFNSFTSSPNGTSGWDTTVFGAPGYAGNRALGNQEYLSDSSVGVNPFSVGGGVLTITAAPGSNPAGKEYNSGVITTEGDFSQAYGYFEMRAELPQGAGMWPAFWMYPETGYGIRELDVMEAFGAPAPDGEGGSDTYHYNVHDNGLSGTQDGAWVPTNVNIYDSYNTYGMMWTPTTITFYFDGEAVAQEATPADMNVPMYMIATVAVGGSWPGEATGETAQMKIDYIRAFSSNSAIPAVALQPISSPDGGGTNLYGATYAGESAPTPSANDTIVLAGSTAAITDASGNAWTITSSGQVAVNGTTDAATSNVIELAYVNGTIWKENSSKLWSGETQPNNSWSAATTTSPLPIAGSPNDTFVLAGSTAAITDASGNAWTITSGGQVAVNGVTDAITSHVIELAYVNGTIWQLNTWKNWYGETKPNNSWSAATTTSPLVVSVPASEASVPVGFINGTVNVSSGDHLFFISGHADTFNLSGGSETITDGGSGLNTFNLPAAGNGSAIFNAAALTDGDLFGLKTALAATKWTGSTSTLSSFLHTAPVGATTELLVSTTPAGSGTGTLLATFATSNVSLSTILAHSTT